MSGKNVEDSLKKSIGLLDSLNQMAEDAEKNKKEISTDNQPHSESTPISLESIFRSPSKPKYVPKGFTLKEDQIKKIEKYSKKAKKNESEFIRSVLDYFFSILEQEE